MQKSQVYQSTSFTQQSATLMKSELKSVFRLTNKTSSGFMCSSNLIPSLAVSVLLFKHECFCGVTCFFRDKIVFLKRKFELIWFWFKNNFKRWWRSFLVIYDWIIVSVQCRTNKQRTENTSAFQWDASWPLHWPLLDVSTRRGEPTAPTPPGGRPPPPGGKLPRRQIPFLETDPPHEQNDWQMPLKTLPSLADGKK